MGLLDKLKSLFGSDQSGQSPARRNDADVTVEHEPAAESEHAVKGTDTGRQQGGTQPQQGQPQGSHQQGQPQDQQPAGGQTAESEAAAGTAADTGETEPDAPTSTPDGTADATAETDAGDDGPDTEPADDDDSGADTVESPSVEEIKGIGPTYAERLEAAGIRTVADLAAADPADVAEAAETGENRAGDWVERAQDF
jgi:predicted flap endonuclease-1-like 5' DNA nuclease